MVDAVMVKVICTVTRRDQAKINLCGDKAPTNRNREDELSSVGDKHYDTKLKALQYNSMELHTGDDLGSVVTHCPHKQTSTLGLNELHSVQSTPMSTNTQQSQ